MLLLDVIIGFIIVGSALLIFKARSAAVNSLTSQPPATEYHPVLGYIFKPNLDLTVRHERGAYVLKTDSRGVRNTDEVPFKKRDQSVYRILVFGDSFTAADSVSNKERYSDLLQNMMKNTEVINFGVSGYGTDQQLLMFEELGRKFEFDMVLVSPLLENIRRNTVRYRVALDRKSGKKILVPKPYYELKEDRLIPSAQPVPSERPLLERCSKELRGEVDLGGSAATYAIRNFINSVIPGLKPLLIKALKKKSHPEYYDALSYEWRLMKAILKRFKTIAADKPVILCPLPYYIHIENLESPDEYLKRFKELEEISGVYVADVFSAFEGLTKKQRRQCRWKRDIHYTPYAHCLIAGSLYRQIKKLGIVPAGYTEQ